MEGMSNVGNGTSRALQKYHHIPTIFRSKDLCGNLMGRGGLDNSLVHRNVNVSYRKKFKNYLFSNECFGILSMYWSHSIPLFVNIYEYAANVTSGRWSVERSLSQIQ